MSFYGYRWAYSPPYFPDGNAIEFIFAIVKRQFKKLKVQAITNKKKVEMNDLINRSFEIVNREHVINCIRHSN